jgi:branched-chain amino acid transport system ATP-binding protein
VTTLVADGQPVGASGSVPLLETRGLAAGYHGVAAISDIDLVVRPGEIVALLGRNGAGKTTLLHTLAGKLRPLAGAVLVDGEVTRASLHRRARDGLALVTEERSVFSELSVSSNLRLGRGEAAAALALFPELEPLLRRRAGRLSGGEQQILTLARALAGRPRALLADELSLGLAPLVVERLLSALRDAAAEGLGVLLVEQHTQQALRASDRVYVIQRGRIVHEGLSRDLLRRPELLEAIYLDTPSS